MVKEALTEGSWPVRCDRDPGAPRKTPWRYARAARIAATNTSSNKTETTSFFDSNSLAPWRQLPRITEIGD
jgi:hypothetical protein